MKLLQQAFGIALIGQVALIPLAHLPAGEEQTHREQHGPDRKRFARANRYRSCIASWLGETPPPFLCWLPSEQSRCAEAHLHEAHGGACKVPLREARSSNLLAELVLLETGEQNFSRQEDAEVNRKTEPLPVYWLLVGSRGRALFHLAPLKARDENVALDEYAEVDGEAFQEVFRHVEVKDGVLAYKPGAYNTLEKGIEGFLIAPESYNFQGFVFCK
ncbi:hypothetical protein OPT61_g4083 [Boeremia exigua]|uniref:Uncharacterized protein n=1 Tax=Boeremia exigua TaxID=749465 RepID=A0ACC2IFK9_9PLEO|nr:hypothetical protein OPT61_g4083 [Boeremia exigua]